MNAPRTPSRARTFRTLIVLLLGGALLTILSAWGASIKETCSAGKLRRGGWQMAPIGSARSPTGPLFALVQERHLGYQYTVGVTFSHIETADIDWPSDFSTPTEDALSVSAKSYGWPFLAMYTRAETRRVITNDTLKIVEDIHGQYTLPWFGAFEFKLPLLVSLPGFAADTAVYALLLSFPIILRRRKQARRARAGQCTACGYSLTGVQSGMCPECGTPT